MVTKELVIYNECALIWYPTTGIIKVKNKSGELLLNIHGVDPNLEFPITGMIKDA